MVFVLSSPSRLFVLCSGMTPAELHMNPDNYPIYDQFFQGHVDTITTHEINIDGKGRLFQVHHNHNHVTSLKYITSYH